MTITTIKKLSLGKKPLSPLRLLISLLPLLLCLSLGDAASAANRESIAGDVSATLKAERAKSSEILERISKRVALLEKIESPDDLQKSELTWLSQARDFLQKNIASVDRTLDYLQTSEAAPLRLKSTEKELAAPLPGEEIKVDESLPLATLEAQLETRRGELETHRRIRVEVEAEVTRRIERQQTMVEESASARKRLEELAESLVSSPGGVSDKASNARQSELSAEKNYFDQRLQELEQEGRSYDNTRELLRARRQLAERRVLVTERHFTAMELTVNRLRTEAAAQAMQAADVASLAAISAHPLVRAIADENQKLAAELAKISVASIALSQEKQRLDETLDTTRRRFEGIKEKIAQIGLTDAIGLKLRSDRSQLPETDRYVKNLKARRAEINRVQLRRIEIEDRLLELVDLERESLRRVSASDIELTESGHKALVSAVTQALGEQKETYLNELIKAYDIYFEKNLYPFLEEERNLISLIGDYSKFIDTRVLWIQSAPLLGFNDLKRFGSAVAWLLYPVSWGQTIAGLGSDLRNNPLQVIVPLLVIAILLAFQRRLKENLTNLSRHVTKLSKAKFTDVLWAGLVTVMMTLPWPLLLYLLAWRTSQLSTDHAYTTALSSGFFAIANLLLGGLLLRRLCRKDGLGESHFRWKSDNLTLIRKQLNWYLPITLPLTFILSATLNQPTQAHHDSLGRLAFLVAMVISALLVYRLMHPERGLLSHKLNKNPEGWSHRLTGVWFPALILTPLALAVAATLGYMYTAVQLEQHIISIITLLFALIVARGILIRWLDIAQRKLAMEQWRKRIAAQAENIAGDEKPQSSESSELNISDEAEIDVSAISTQTMKLLNSIYWFAIAVGVALIWAEVLPAFNILNEVVLWSSDVASSQSGTGLTTQVPTTLANLLLAIIVLLMTFFVAGNIPGLLEIAILQQLPFTPSGRYAITSIVRYILVIVGLAMTFNAIGIGWSKIQWLAAAITLGLGFGLQEIFANFVSGLIILFERPVRVGDAVTVGNISGRISRIQIRATTITDWDRKELIIPNKEFVTGQVINWSLSDTILRILIPVGIAYGSDTHLACRTLLTVAANHPNVLKDPEPSARFAAFGESTLDFELRVYIPNWDLFLETRHELLMEIDQLFRDAGIEIAFPQHDVHIRTDAQGVAAVRTNSIDKDI